MALWQLMHLGTWCAVHDEPYMHRTWWTIHTVPKSISCHKAIKVITGRAHRFHDCIYYAHFASARFEHSLCRGSLMTTYIYIYICIICIYNIIYMYNMYTWMMYVCMYVCMFIYVCMCIYLDLFRYLGMYFFVWVNVFMEQFVFSAITITVLL